MEVFVSEVGATLFDEDVHLGSELLADLSQLLARACVVRKGIQRLQVVADRREVIS